ncbi:MAG: sigma-70 family RNA polymerase sigma factor [Fuerstiella sp.]
MTQDDSFLERMTAFQGRLYGFVLSLLGDADQANEVLQETNLVLWKKSDEFQPGSDFKAWSFRVAHFQVMAFRQRQVRDRLVFDEQALEKVYREAMDVDTVFEQKKERLDECVESLSTGSQEVLTRFYVKGESLREIGAVLNRKANSVGQTLFRIRKALIECVSDEKWGNDGI